MLQQPRTDQIRLRVSPAEKARIGERAEASGLGISAYVRRQALGEPEAAKSPAPAPSPAKSKQVDSPPSPAASSSPSTKEPSPLAPTQPDEAKVAARARQLYGRGLTRRQAAIQARRELT